MRAPPAKAGTGCGAEAVSITTSPSVEVDGEADDVGMIEPPKRRRIDRPLAN
jgi:hypothetical protein